MSDLPEGWVEARLGEVATTQLGKMLSKKSKTGVGSRPYLRNKNVQWFRFDLTDVGEMDFSDAEFTRFCLQQGDLLVCEGGEIGRAAIWRGQVADCCFQKAVHRVQPTDAVRTEYLQYLLRHMADSGQLDKHVTGSTIKHLPQEDLRILTIPLPPAAEQHRIVAVVEEQFSRLDAAEESLHRARRTLERFRGTVLDAAFVGDWDTSTIGEIAEVQGGIQKQPKRKPAENRFPFLRVANVLRGRLDLQVVHEVELFAGEIDRYRLRPGDILVVEGNGSIDQIGRSAMWRGEIPDCVHQNHLIRVRPAERADPEYIETWWNSPQAARRLASVASSTTGLHTLSTAKLKALELPVPPLEEQQRIVADVERQLSLIDAQAKAIETALKRSATLRRAILERAFSGKLVPQDPSDEPASALLERIQAAGAEPKTVPRDRARASK